MTDKEREILNFYLNDCFRGLEVRDGFLLGNIHNLALLAHTYTAFIDTYEIEEESICNHLTYEDVMFLAREVIGSISKEYLTDFDLLMENGELDFGYEKEYRESSFTYLHNAKCGLIDINRDFHYSDVITLVHEFMHYTNGKTDHISYKRYILAEFFSIYFEIYAQEYLIKKKSVPREEMDYYLRLRNIKYHANAFQSYDVIFFMYQLFGEINLDYFHLLNGVYFQIELQDFDQKCLSLLQHFEKVEKKYKIDIMYEKNYDDYEFSMYLSCGFCNHYRYLLGGVLAFYAFDHCDMKDIVYLNDHINSEALAHVNIFDFLYRVGIPLTSNNFFDDAFASMKKWIYDDSPKKHQRVGAIL